MARINQKFIESYLYNKLLEAIRPLNEFKDAIDSTEQVLKAKIEGIIQQIISIEI
jgi:hypothetical protein